MMSIYVGRPLADQSINFFDAQSGVAEGTPDCQQQKVARAKIGDPADRASADPDNGTAVSQSSAVFCAAGVHLHPFQSSVVVRQIDVSSRIDAGITPF